MIMLLVLDKDQIFLIYLTHQMCFCSHRYGKVSPVQIHEGLEGEGIFLKNGDVRAHVPP